MHSDPVLKDLTAESEGRAASLISSNIYLREEAPQSNVEFQHYKQISELGCTPIELCKDIWRSCNDEKEGSGGKQAASDLMLWHSSLKTAAISV